MRGKQSDKTRALLKPMYSIEPGADGVELGEAPIEIKNERAKCSGVGHATLFFQPRFILSIEASFPDSAIGAYSALSAADPVEFKYGETFEIGKALVTSVELKMEAGATRLRAQLMPNPQRMISGESDQLLSSLSLHIVNFPSFLSSGENSDDFDYETPAGGWRLLGRSMLSDPPWQLELQEMPETKAIVEKLKKTAGFGITHLAQLTRQDGGAFNAKEADAVVQNFYLFLSFARGAWAPPVLSVGFDQHGEKSYENWGVRLGTPWETNRGWFDLHRGQSLGALYPGFRSLLHKSKLGKAVSNALYWYLRSNRGGEGAGIDSGIILSQAALERLASAYLEANSAHISSTRSTAADNLRETLAQLGIPSAIPNSLSALTDGQSKGCWKDGPEAVTRVRNELVHPKNRLPFKVGLVIPDTWNLSQWYIELIILRLAGYDGEYSNRLKVRWIGEVESVPWKAA